MTVATGRAPVGRAVVDVAVYSAARLALVVALTAVIYGLGRLLGLSDFPPIIAAMLALIVALPLGMWIFTPLRKRATESLTVAGERRRREREQLQARLRGDAEGDD
ncbi:hypothetical protein AWC18_09760 [Mycolicibacter nonchromogenicus]|uniref:DUF4229 domain-containing protein n=1 Tax=Mycolicibacter nonchromogenicus TaxID=1782 RepID=A0A1X1ZCX2_MYCNO|nr:hypothetical protein A5715_16380 [Mycolicibacter heraklionensis]ORW21168.1 hypothetical protein AWC18_09760 [Mycolicibacter nonchromogenicus]